MIRESSEVGYGTYRFFSYIPKVVLGLAVTTNHPKGLAVFESLSVGEL